MNFWKTVTGSDLTRDWKAFEVRAPALPADHRAAWEEVGGHLLPHADFTGRNLVPILDGVLGLLEETAADGQDVQDVPGGMTWEFGTSSRARSSGGRTWRGSRRSRRTTGSSARRCRGTSSRSARSA